MGMLPIQSACQKDQRCRASTLRCDAEYDQALKTGYGEYIVLALGGAKYNFPIIPKIKKKNLSNWGKFCPQRESIFNAILKR